MSKRNLPIGILAGIAGGLVASFVMNEFIAHPGKKISEAIETPEDKKQLKALDDGRDATMKTADAIAVTATGGQHLTYEQQSKAGPVIHYAFGGLMGGVYGALAEVSPAARSGFGTTFGSMLFAGADLFAVPALQLGPSLEEEPASSLATPLAAHLVYGATTELIRRLVRKLL
jgi:putative membrane protein